MNKCIILSVKPRWLHKILTGKKTIEIRKSMPKCDYPIDVYLYCTKEKPFLMVGRNDNKTYLDNGGKESVYSPNHNYIGNGKIVAKFTLNKVEKIKLEYVDHPELGYGVNENCGDDWYEWESDDLLEKCCLAYDELYIYGHHKDLYAWHIDNLQIFDKPMELREFYRNNYQVIQDYEYCNNYDCIYAIDNSILGDDGYCPVDECPRLRISRPPQSWGYAYKE